MIQFHILSTLPGRLFRVIRGSTASGDTHGMLLKQVIPTHPRRPATEQDLNTVPQSNQLARLEERGLQV